MTEETVKKEIEKPSVPVKKEGVTNEQLSEQLTRMEKLIERLDQKLSKPLIS
jgi:hypothetical protein